MRLARHSTQALRQRLPSAAEVKSKLDKVRQNARRVKISRTKKNKYGEPERHSGLFDDSDEEEHEPIYNEHAAHTPSCFDNRARPAVVADPRSHAANADTCQERYNESPISIAQLKMASREEGSVDSTLPTSFDTQATTFDVVLPHEGVPLGMSFVQGHGHEVRVTIVRSGGHAAINNIEVGMIVTAINGVEVTEDAALNRMLLAERAKGEVKLTLSNSGQEEFAEACVAAKIARSVMKEADLAKQQQKEKRLFGMGKKAIRTVKHKAKLDRTTLVMPVTIKHRPTSMADKEDKRAGSCEGHHLGAASP